jgi:hypothetical protein
MVDMVMMMLENDACVDKAFNCGARIVIWINELANTIIDLYSKDLTPEFWLSIIVMSRIAMQISRWLKNFWVLA